MKRHSIALMTILTAGCGARTATESSNLHSPIVATAAADITDGAAPLAVHFRGSAAGGEGALTLTWTFGDGTSSVGSEATHVFPAQGSFLTTLTATDARTNASSTVPIHVGAALEKPDLLVQSVSVSASSVADRFEPNDTTDRYIGGRGYIWVLSDATIAPIDLTVHALIRNAGAEIIAPFDVDLFSSQPAAGARGDDGARLSKMSAGETQDMAFTIPNVLPGIHDAWITADAGNEIVEADETNDVSTRASVEVTGDVDKYSVYEIAGKSITVDLSGLPADYDVSLSDDFGNELGRSVKAGTSAEQIVFPVTASGYYVVKVWGAFGVANAAPYHLEITVP